MFGFYTTRLEEVSVFFKNLVMYDDKKKLFCVIFSLSFRVRRVLFYVLDDSVTFHFHSRGSFEADEIGLSTRDRSFLWYIKYMDKC